MAAGVLIVEEAGGKVTDHRGGGLDPGEGEGLVASNRLVRRSLMGIAGDGDG